MSALPGTTEIREFATARTSLLDWIVYFSRSRTGLFLLVISILFTIATATIFFGGLLLYACYVFLWASVSFNLQYLKWIVQIDGPQVTIEGVRLICSSKRSFGLNDLQTITVHDGALEMKLASQASPALVLIGCSESEVERCRDFLTSKAARDVATS